MLGRRSNGRVITEAGNLTGGGKPKMISEILSTKETLVELGVKIKMSSREPFGALCQGWLCLCGLVSEHRYTLHFLQ